MRGSCGLVASIVLFGCVGCCCGRLPTFGLGPEVDEAELAARVRAEPLVIDHICRAGEDCVAVEDAEVRVWPASWSPFDGEVVAVLEVEATCTPREGLTEPLLCAGTLAAVWHVADDGTRTLAYVTEDTLLAGEPSGLTYEAWLATSGEGGDWD